MLKSGDLVKCDYPTGLYADTYVGGMSVKRLGMIEIDELVFIVHLQGAQMVVLTKDKRLGWAWQSFFKPI